MSGYGKVINGGVKMSKGLTKGINDKLSGRAKEDDRRAVVADAVNRAFIGASLSDMQTNDIRNSGKFTSKKSPKNV
jgi:hypothetical protein